MVASALSLCVPTAPSSTWWQRGALQFSQSPLRLSLPQDGVSMKRISEQGIRISNKKPRKAGSAGNMLYGRFVKVTGLGRRLGEQLVCPGAQLIALWPSGPPFPCLPFPLRLSLQSATLTAHGEEATTLPAGSGGDEEEDEEKLDLSSARRQGWGGSSRPSPPCGAGEG